MNPWTRTRNNLSALYLFYTPEIQPQHEFFALNEEESKHAIRVLRMVSGDQVHLVDGKGGWYAAVITDAHPKRTVMKITEVRLDVGKRPYHLHMAVAPTKHIERLEWFLEKVTEVGIDEVTPLICERSERREVKIERLNKVMVAAMKQSLKARLPRLNEPAKYTDFLANPFPGKRFIAHCADGDKAYLNRLLGAGENALIMIGPEGDFSGGEIAAALQVGFVPLSLGTARLRTETAALAACLEASVINR